MKQSILGLVILFLLGGVMSVEASTVLRSGAAVSVANDQAVDANFYAWGNSVTVSGEMAGDVVAAGGTVTINGQVAHDVLAAGGTVTISGDIGDDVRIVGGDVIIEGTVAGSLTVFSGRVKILSNATIAGDVIIYGGDAIIEGIVGGQVMGTVNTLRINGAIEDDVDVTVNSLTLGERTVLNGNLSYVSQVELTRATDASIAGSIVRNDPARATRDGDLFRVLAMVMLIVMFGTLTLYLVSKQRVMNFANEVMTQPLWRSVLVGFAVIITAPFVVGLLLASVLGILVGLLILLIFLILLLHSTLLLPVSTGSFLAAVTRYSIQNYFLVWILIGSTFLALIILIPVVGVVLAVTFLLITVGTNVQLLTSWLLRDNIITTK